MLDKLKQKIENLINSKYKKVDMNRVYTLYYMNIALSFILIVLLFVLLVIVPDISFIYIVIILVLFICQLLSIFLTINGYYIISAWLTVWLAFIVTWASILYENEVYQGDLFPVFYIAIVVFLSSLLLSKRDILIVSVAEVICLVVFFSLNPQLSSQNLPSLYAFIIIGFILIYAASWINSNQIKKIKIQNELIKANEKDLINSEERYRGLVDSLDSGIVIHGPDMKVVDCNQKATEMLGFTKKQIKGKVPQDPYWHFLDKDFNKLPLDKYPVVIAKNTMKSFKEYVIGVKQEQSITWASVNAFVRTDGNGNLLEIIISFVNITYAHNYKQQLLKMSFRDALTGLYNRRYYEDRLQYYFDKDVFPLSIIMADIDKLKLVNDNYGHQKGDEFIVNASKSIQSCFLSQIEICRIGGDEFVILLPRTDYEEANQFVSCMKKNVEKVIIEKIQLSISFGIATRYNKDIDMKELFNTAEEMMYQTKVDKSVNRK